MINYQNHFDLVNPDRNILEKGYQVIKDEATSARIGYYALPHDSQSLIEEVKNLATAFENTIDTIAVIGIGGSSLGIKAIDRLLRMDTPNAKKIVYLENSDPFSIIEQMAKIDPSRTMFVVISKSGGTVETLSIFKHVITSFELSLQSSKQIIIISDDGSILSNFADEYSLKRYIIPANVGGRFSVLSAVGVVPLVLAGFDALSILKGAESFLERFWGRNEEHLLEKAYYYVTHSKQFSINALFAYSNAFEEFGKWIVQLWGESLGKINNKGERVGMTPIALIGSVDQHSFLQLVIEGPLDKTMTFMRIEDSHNDLMIPDMSLPFLEKVDFVNGSSFNELINGQCRATMQSVLQSGVSVDEIVWKSLDPTSVGEMIIYYEVLTSACGALMEINTYDQPGVELGKKILEGHFR